jgi:chromate reductase
MRLLHAYATRSPTRKVLGIIGADVIDQELPIGQADAAFGEHGELVEPGQRAVLADLVGVLAARAGALEAAAA